MSNEGFSFNLELVGQTLTKSQNILYVKWYEILLNPKGYAKFLDSSISLKV